jgi:hypothetical protein
VSAYQYPAATPTYRPSGPADPTAVIGRRIGAWVIRKLSGIPITDALTGYRALTRHAALTLNVLTARGALLP